MHFHYPYTAIFGRGVLTRFKIAIKQSYLCMKTPSPFGIIAVHGDQAASRRIEGKPTPGYSLINEVSKKSPNGEANSESKVEPRAEAAKDTQNAPLSKLVPEKCVHVGSDLTEDEKDRMLAFLHENQDVFAWSAKDLQGVSRDLAQHNLNVAKMAKPRKQKLRKMFAERADAAKAEVQRLLYAGVIRPVQYPEWLANVVMVRKKNMKW